MVYKIKISNMKSDTAKTYFVPACSVFDAIDTLAKMIDDPEDMELISATPIMVK